MAENVRHAEQFLVPGTCHPCGLAPLTLFVLAGSWGVLRALQDRAAMQQREAQYQSQLRRAEQLAEKQQVRRDPHFMAAPGPERRCWRLLQERRTGWEGIVSGRSTMIGRIAAAIGVGDSKEGGREEGKEQGIAEGGQRGEGEGTI